MLNDIRQAGRVLASAPGFAVVAILTLAVGIGLNTTLFSIVNALLFRPLPVQEPGRLVWIASASTRPDGPRGNLTLPDLLDYAAQRDVLSGAAGFTEAPVALRAGERAVRLTAQVVTSNYFALLGVTPAVGRGFRPEEDRVPGGHPVVVISDALWRQEFGAAPEAVGATVALNGAAYSVIGVAPRGFAGVDIFSPADVWVPLSMAGHVIPGIHDTASRESWWLRGVGRLAGGASLSAAQGRLRAAAAATARAFPASHAFVTVRVAEFHGAEPGDRSAVMRVSALLLGVTLSVLLIACANVAGLLVSRAAGREREIGIRLALGATRRRLARQLFAESLVIAALAGCTSLLLSLWAADAVVPLLDLPTSVGVHVDWRVAAFTAAASLLAALAFGLTPALRAAGQDLLPALRSEPGADARPRHSLLQRGIVVGQVAGCLVLLVTAGLFLRALWTGSRMHVGFEYANRVSVSMDLRMQGYTSERAEAFYRNLVGRVGALPGIRAATIAQYVPLGGRVAVHGLEFAGQAQDPDAQLPRASVNQVWPGYFTTLEIRIVRGRDFTAADLRDEPQSAIVNETMAARYWKNEDPIGRQFSIEHGKLLTVVGVARDTLVDEFNERPWASVYVPYAPRAGEFSLIAWTAGSSADAIRGIESVVRSLDADLPLFRSMPLSSFIAERMDAERALSRMLAACGALALVLASLGLYGVMAYSVARRRREIGVRMAFGAGRPDILLLFVAEGIRLSGYGVLFGLLPAVAVSRFLSSQLVGVSTFDPPTFALTAGVLAVVTACAAWLPARRAAGTDLIASMRAE